MCAGSTKQKKVTMLASHLSSMSRVATPPARKMPFALASTRYNTSSRPRSPVSSIQTAQRQNANSSVSQDANRLPSRAGATVALARREGAQARLAFTLRVLDLGRDLHHTRDERTALLTTAVKTIGIGPHVAKAPLLGQAVGNIRRAPLGLVPLQLPLVHLVPRRLHRCTRPILPQVGFVALLT